jgi:hypothetical protein
MPAWARSSSMPSSRLRAARASAPGWRWRRRSARRSARTWSGSGCGPTPTGAACRWRGTATAGPTGHWWRGCRRWAGRTGRCCWRIPAPPCLALVAAQAAHQLPTGRKAPGVLQRDGVHILHRVLLGLGEVRGIGGLPFAVVVAPPVQRGLERLLRQHGGAQLGAGALGVVVVVADPVLRAGLDGVGQQVVDEGVVVELGLEVQPGSARCGSGHTGSRCPTWASPTTGCPTLGLPLCDFCRSASRSSASTRPPHWASGRP